MSLLRPSGFGGQALRVKFIANLGEQVLDRRRRGYVQGIGAQELGDMLENMGLAYSQGPDQQNGLILGEARFNILNRPLPAVDHFFRAGNDRTFDLGDRLGLKPQKANAFEKFLGADKNRVIVIYCRSFR